MTAVTLPNGMRVVGANAEGIAAQIKARQISSLQRRIVALESEKAEIEALIDALRDELSR